MKYAVVLTLFFLFHSQRAFSAEQDSFRSEIELSSVWQTRNVARIPGNGGTEFSLVDYNSSANFSARFSFFWEFSEKHEVKLMILPLALSGTSTPNSDITFQDKTFAAGVSTEANYKFHSYRATYRYRVWENESWRIKLGFTAKIRNARIALSQSNVSSEKTDLGFVPLLNFSVVHQLSDEVRIELEGDALAAPQGRAEDVALIAWWKPDVDLEIGAGYRTLEGGASNDAVYTFAWLHFFSILGAYTF